MGESSHTKAWHQHWCQEHKSTHKWKRGKCVVRTIRKKSKCRKGRNGKSCRKSKRTRQQSVETISTDEVTCIARTTVREVVRTADAEVHADAGVLTHLFAPISGDLCFLFSVVS